MQEKQLPWQKKESLSENPQTAQKNMNHYIHICGKVIADDDIGYKTARKPYAGYYD